MYLKPIQPKLLTNLFIHKTGLIPVLLNNEGKLSKDIILMLDETYLQKSNEDHAGNLVGKNSEGELCRGILVFMIVGC